MCRDINEHMRHIIYVVIILACTGCDVFCDDGRERAGLNQLVERSEQWSALDYKNYTISYLSCGQICTGQVITLSNNIVTEVRSTGSSGSETFFLPNSDARFNSVDAIFDFVRELNVSVDVLKVQYDSPFGYPSVISVDPEAMRTNCDGSGSDTVDDEYTYTIQVEIDQ